MKPKAKSVKVNDDLLKQLCHRGYTEALIKAIERKCGHPSEIVIEQENVKFVWKMRPSILQKEY